tara:strand:- start:79 stop:570 length:492 start_codon:yes stop_codon:yes gene_type:complete
MEKSLKKNTMPKVILYEPEIPQNTGNIIRLCANTGVTLDLIKPLGFSMEEKKLRRAGLDYHEHAKIKVHKDLASCMPTIRQCRLFAVSTKAAKRYDSICFEPDDCFLFGPETRGLPMDILDNHPEERKLRIPMRISQRSLNLANAVSIVVYECLRQLGFNGLK